MDVFNWSLNVEIKRHFKFLGPNIYLMFLFCEENFRFMNLSNNENREKKYHRIGSVMKIFEKRSRIVWRWYIKAGLDLLPGNFNQPSSPWTLKRKFKIRTLFVRSNLYGFKRIFSIHFLHLQANHSPTII